MNSTRQLDWVGGESAPAPFARGSETSKAAAESLTNTETLRGLVYEAIKVRNGRGATDQEIQELLKLPPNVETPRRWELVKAGLVRDSGLRRKTRSNRNAAVWVTTTPKARE